MNNYYLAKVEIKSKFPLFILLLKFFCNSLSTYQNQRTGNNM